MSRGAFLGFQIFCLLVALICVALGAWQVQRHYWKAGLLAAAANVAERPAVDLPQDPSDLDTYQSVRLTGQFVLDRDIVIRGFAIEGVSGSRLYAPFVLADGRTVLIQRGWVPRGQEDLAGVRDDRVQTLEVAWRQVPKRTSDRSLFSLVNAPEMDLWTHVDTQALADWWDMPRLVQDAFGELRGPQEAVPGLVIEAFKVDLFNRHLEYVATWWSLAAILLIIYVLIWRGRRRAS